MTTLVQAELDKLRTLRSTRVALAINVLLSVAIATIVLATIKHLSDGPSEVGEAAFALMAFATGLVCANAFASEYNDRTIATTFTLVPERWRVVAAKAVAAAIAGALAAALAAATSYTLTAVWLAHAHVVWPWSAGQLVQAVSGDLVLAIVLAVAGVGVGGLTQSPPIAGSVMGLCWFGLSNLLATFVTFFRHYGLPAAATALTRPTGERYYSFAGALAVTTAVTVVLLVAGLRRAQHTDIR